MMEATHANLAFHSQLFLIKNNLIRSNKQASIQSWLRPSGILNLVFCYTKSLRRSN